MRIGILTFHRGLNHGGFLQAYCLQEELRDMGHDPVAINYQNRSHRWGEHIKPWYVMRRPLTIFDFVSKQIAFRRDWKYLNLSKFTTSPEQVDRMHFDVVVIGSDIVWDVSLFGEDRLYFGTTGCTNHLISYAASCGKLSPDYNLSDTAIKGLANFKTVLVRDDPTAKLVTEHVKSSPQKVLDPCLLYDLNKIDLAGKQMRCQLPQKDYLLVYAYELTPDQIEKIRREASKKGLITVAAGYRQAWCDINLMQAGPFDLLNLCRHAAAMISGTYHGTIFAISYNLPFVVHAPPAVYPKLFDLLSLLSLKERMNFKNIIQLLKVPPNIMPEIEKWRECSHSLLEKGVNS